MLKSPGVLIAGAAVVACASTVLLSCRKDEPTNSISVDLRRSGAFLEPTDAHYYDAQPSLSDDGTEVVFISGRDSAPGLTDLRKAYKTTWPTATAPQPLTRVTTTNGDVSEEDARLSPDGRWVAVTAVTKGQRDLFLQDFAGKQSLLPVTNDSAMEAAVSFSPDSKLLAWIKNDVSAGTATAVVVEIGDASTGALSKQVTVSAAGEYVRQLLWIPQAKGTAGYQLAVATAAPGAVGAGYNYTLRTFADAAGAATAAATSWVSNFPAKAGVAPAAANGKAVLVRQVPEADGATTEQVGTGTSQPPPPVKLVSEPALVATTAGAQPQTWGKKPGFDLTAVGLSSDGSTAFMLSRYFYICYADPVTSFGSAFSISPTDPTKTGTPLSPRLSATSATPLASDYKMGFSFSGGGFCDRRNPDGSDSLIDDKLLDMVVSRSSTASRYRLAYVTALTPHFDAFCMLKAGDKEVWLLDVDGDKRTFYKLSDNQQPLADTDRDNSRSSCSYGVFGA